MAHQHKQQVEKQQAMLFQEKVERLSENWDDPKNRDLTISSTDLAILSNRTPPDAPAAHRLTFGVRIFENPVSYAQQRASFFTELEANLNQTLLTRVQLDLRVFKSDAAETDLLAQGKADFMVMEATSFLEAKKEVPGIIPIAGVAKDWIGVLMARTQSGITQLKELAGKSILFSARSDPLTVWAKARLADAGLFSKDLKLVTNLVTQPTYRASSREVAAAVLRGQVDAGTVPMQRYELEMRSGLVLLDKFPITPRVFVARQGLETNLIAAFRFALLHLKGFGKEGLDSWNLFEGHQTVPDLVPIGDSYFDGLREALRKAARFDGEPDPYPRESKLPERRQ
jgi:ABC-type phosphate/phosphonate transport system substrate-binding protein